MQNIVPSNDPQDNPPKKTCTGPCGQEYPATLEYFDQREKGLRNQCKICRKEYRNRPEVKEHVREHAKEYYNKPEIKEYRKEYRKKYDKEYRSRQEVKEYIKEYQKEYYIKPEVKEHRKEHSKKYLSKPEVKERQKKYQKEYYNKPEKQEMRRIRVRNRRAHKKSIVGIHTHEQIQNKLKQQKHKCYYCKARLKKVKGRYIYHIEHTFPLSRVAGTDIPANSIDYLVLSCPTCNLSKGDKFPWEWAQGGRLL